MRMKKKIKNVKKDNKIFNRTAIGTKAGNISQISHERGGKAW